MRNIWSIFRDDIRYSTSNIVSILVVLGMCLVPAIYAWTNIAGSWDPQGSAHQLKVAVANSDEGYRSSLRPTKVNVGDRVIDALRNNDEYGWVFVDEMAALDGVCSGEYYAAVVIPADFSTKLMTVLSSDSEKASVNFYLNMKEDPVAPILAGENGAEVVEGIRANIDEAVNSMALGLATDASSLAKGDDIQDLGAVLIARLDAVSDNLIAVASQVRAVSDLSDAASALTATTAPTLSGSDDDTSSSRVASSRSSRDTSSSASSEDEEVAVLGDSVFKVSDELDKAVSSARSAASSLQKELGQSDDQSVASELANDVESLASSVEQISHSADAIASSMQGAMSGLTGSSDSLAEGLGGISESLNTAATKLEGSSRALSRFKNSVSMALENGDLEEVAQLVGGDPKGVAEWLAAPVQVEGRSVYSAANYGVSRAPFYTVLSLWLGAALLTIIMKAGVSTDRLRRYEEKAGRAIRGYEEYFGRFAIFAVFSLLQATIVCLGDVFFLQVQCAHPLMFLVACWVCSFVFCNIAYTLVVSFGEVGMALCIAMLVVQMVGSGGAYPLQMMGDLFQAVHPFLPFTYGMSAMQEAVAGLYGAEYLVSMACVCAFLIPSLLLGLAIRRPVARFANFFGSKLHETGLM